MAFGFRPENNMLRPSQGGVFCLGKTMKIKSFQVTSLRLPLKTPYIWSQGVEDAFHVNLIAMEAEDGTIGYGETTTAPDATAQARHVFPSQRPISAHTDHSIDRLHA